LNAATESEDVMTEQQEVADDSNEEWQEEEDDTYFCKFCDMKFEREQVNLSY